MRELDLMRLVAAGKIHGKAAVLMCSVALVAQWGGSWVLVILMEAQEGLKAPYLHPVRPLNFH